MIARLHWQAGERDPRPKTLLSKPASFSTCLRAGSQSWDGRGMENLEPSVILYVECTLHIFVISRNTLSFWYMTNLDGPK